MVLPWPGESEWSAPQPIASSSARMTTPTERSSSSSPDSPLGEEASTVLSGSAVSGATAPAPAPGGPGGRRRRHVEGALQQPPGVGAQLVGHVLRAHGGVGQPRPARGAHQQLVPADAPGVGAHVHGQAVGRARRGADAGGAVPGGIAQHLEAAGAGAEARRLRDRHDRGPAAVDREVDLAHALGGPRGGVGLQAPVRLDRRALAEGGDLGHVHHLAQVEPAAARLHAQVAVDREVAKRVGARLGRRAHQQRGQGHHRDEDAPPAHESLASSRRATGAQRTEKAGFRASASDSRCRAASA